MYNIKNCRRQHNCLIDDAVMLWLNSVSGKLIP